MNFFEHIIFDLDDTLLDTSGALIPAAARRAVEAMLRASSEAMLRASSEATLRISSATPDHERDVQVLLQRRSEILRADPRADVWLQLAHGNDEVADVGRRAFFAHPIEAMPGEALRPTPGAIEILHWTRERATLHLVTSGDQPTQEKKIARLGIAHFFESIEFVDPKHAYGRTKNQAFKKTLERFSAVAPASFVSVGNRVDTDLGEAKILGCKTVWIRYGEHANLTPQRPEEIPDFEVGSLTDLLSIWRQKIDSNSRGTNWNP